MSSPKKPEESSKPEDSETQPDSENESEEEHTLANSSQRASGRMNDETLSRDGADSLGRDDRTDILSITLDTASLTIGSKQQISSKCTEECYESVTEKAKEDSKSESSLSLKSPSCGQKPQGSYQVINPTSPTENTIEENDTLSPGSRTRLLSHPISLNPVEREEGVPDTRRARSEERAISILKKNGDPTCNKSIVHDFEANKSELPEFPVLAYEATRMEPVALNGLRVGYKDDGGAANINESKNTGEDGTNEIMGEGTININESGNFGPFNLEVANIGASDVEGQSTSVNAASHQECVPLRESVRNARTQQRRGALPRLVMGYVDDNEAANISEIANIGVSNINQMANIRAYNLNEILNASAANIRPLVIPINLYEFVAFRHNNLYELIPSQRYNRNELVPFQQINENIYFLISFLNRFEPFHRFHMDDVIYFLRFFVCWVLPFEFYQNDFIFRRYIQNEFVPVCRIILNEWFFLRRFHPNELLLFEIRLNEGDHFRRINFNEVANVADSSSTDGSSDAESDQH